MARRGRGGHHEEEHENHERWLVTYADMVTLLMVLFIVMFAMSQVDERKYHELRASLSEGFGAGPTLVDGGNGMLAQGASLQTPADPVAEAPQDLLAQAMPEARPTPAAEEGAGGPADEAAEDDEGAGAELQRLEEVRRLITEALAAHGLADAVTFRYDERGLHVTIVTDEVLFGTGEAALRDQGRAVLDVIGPTVAPLPNHLSVDGHTDDVPISTAPFPSNWELSTARATTVLRYLVDRHGVPTAKVSASGYADQRPLAPNDGPQGRATNRRVEVVVLFAGDPTSQPS